jgi:hypothetical protein
MSKQATTILTNAAAFWKGYESVEDTLRETHAGASLSGLYAEYQDVMSRTPIDLGRVESLTVQAAWLMVGKRTVKG